MAAAIRVRNQSIVDIFWGPGFVVVAVVSFLASRHGGGDEVRRLVVLALTAIWGLRLGLHIGVRNVGHGEDPRYVAIMSHRSGSLVGYVARKIYLPQAVILFVVSLRPCRSPCISGRVWESLAHWASRCGFSGSSSRLSATTS